MFSNIAKVITAIGALPKLLALIPEIMGLVKEVESATATGAQKKAAVLSLLQPALTAVESISGVSLPNATILAFAGDAIDAIVAVYNTLGVFKHASTDPAPAAQAAGTAPAPDAAPSAPAATASSTDPAGVMAAPPPNALLENEFGTTS